MIDQFKQFLLRGNVVDLGVGVVMGVAFTTVVTAFVDDLISPLLALVGGRADFTAYDVEIGGSVFAYGHFVTAVISFLLTAAVLFVAVMLPMNRLIERYRRVETPDPTTRKCPHCFQEIDIRATRCSFCTSEIAPSIPGAE